jgi:hypothetical protein
MGGEIMQTYKIIKFHETGKKKTIKTGLTLKEAQEPCCRKDTKGIDSKGRRWFDGYTKK